MKLLFTGTDKSVVKKLLILLIISFLFLSCGKNPVEKYEEAIEKYKEGSLDRVALEDSFFKAFGKEKPGNETLFFNKRVILNRSDDSIEFVFPEEIKLKIDERIEGSIEYADAGENIFVLGNRKSFYIFTRTGELLASYKVKEDEKIDAIAASASGNSLFFLMDHTVYVYIPETDKAEKLVEGTFPPPYRIYYKADMIVQGNYLALISGIAGSYYISVINTETSSVKMKNIAASSFEFAFTEDEVICIKGTSGKWSLNRYEYKLKNSEKLTPIGKLAAIYLTQDGYILEKDDELILYDYYSNSIIVPFNCSVSGRSGNNIIIRFNDSNYIVDFSSFKKEVFEFKRKINAPEI
jgi:hypothetical protein